VSVINLEECQSADEIRRILFEVIQGEMNYVRDLENITVVRLFLSGRYPLAH
jgi:hypothetical protein